MSSIQTSPTDRLLHQAKEQSSEALGELLEHYRPYLELLARVEIGRRLQTKVDTFDLIQETFLEAKRSFPNFHGSTAAEFAAWLRTIFATRLAVLLRHYFGTKARDPRLEKPLDLQLDQTSQLLDRGLFAAGNSPSQSLVRRERGTQLAQALASLPEDYREVIILRHMEELPFADVAARMGRSLDSVQKLWLRSLAKLRTLLASWEN